MIQSLTHYRGHYCEMQLLICAIVRVPKMIVRQARSFNEIFDGSKMYDTVLVGGEGGCDPRAAQWQRTFSGDGEAHWRCLQHNKAQHH